VTSAAFRSITRTGSTRSRFFLSIKVLRRVFRGKFVAGLQQAVQDGQLSFQGDLILLAQPKIFAAINTLLDGVWPLGAEEVKLLDLQIYGLSSHREAD